MCWLQHNGYADMPKKHKEGASIFIYPAALPLALSPRIPLNSNPNRPWHSHTTSPQHDVTSLISTSRARSLHPLWQSPVFYPALIMYAHDPSVSCWVSLSKDIFSFVHLCNPLPRCLKQWLPDYRQVCTVLSLLPKLLQKKTLGFPLF